jgi:hypothetical protein
MLLARVWASSSAFLCVGWRLTSLCLEAVFRLSRLTEGHHPQ